MNGSVNDSLWMYERIMRDQLQQSTIEHEIYWVSMLTKAGSLLGIRTLNLPNCDSY